MQNLGEKEVMQTNSGINGTEPNPVNLSEIQASPKQSSNKDIADITDKERPLTITDPGINSNIKILKRGEQLQQNAVVEVELVDSGNSHIPANIEERVSQKDGDIQANKCNTMIVFNEDITKMCAEKLCLTDEEEEEVEENNIQRSRSLGDLNNLEIIKVPEHKENNGNKARESRKNNRVIMGEKRITRASSNNQA